MTSKAYGGLNRAPTNPPSCTPIHPLYKYIFALSGGGAARSVGGSFKGGFLP